MNLWNFIFKLCLDTKGEENPTKEEKNVTPPKEGTSGDEPQPKVEKEGEGEGESATSPESKYGEFGDNPTVEQLYEAYHRTKSDHDALKGKQGATERNLALLRKRLKADGIEVMTTENGDVDFRLAADNQPPATNQRQRRFSDKHKELLDPEVWDGISAYTQDLLEDKFEQEEKKRSETMKFNVMRHQANTRMLQLYPSLNSESEGYNEKFYNRATEIWEEQYKTNPRGELIAANEAAIELNISSAKIIEAENKGFNRGKQNKKILGPVGTGDGKNSRGDKLTKDQYLALPLEEREEYDRKQIGL